MREYNIPIMFDVSAATEVGAVARLVDALVDAELTGNIDDLGAGVESWWTIEAGHKAFDGNDNDAGEVVFDDRAAVAPDKVWIVTYVSSNEFGTGTTTEVFATASAAHDAARADGGLTVVTEHIVQREV